MFYIYEVSKDNHYSFTKDKSAICFSCNDGWKYSILEEYPTAEARDIAFRNLYLAEKDNYFFVNYL